MSFVLILHSAFLSVDESESTEELGTGQTKLERTAEKAASSPDKGEKATPLFFKELQAYFC